MTLNILSLLFCVCECVFGELGKCDQLLLVVIICNYTSRFDGGGGLCGSGLVRQQPFTVVYHLQENEQEDDGEKKEGGERISLK